MSNDTETRIAAMKAIADGVTKAVENASATLTTFGVEFNRAYKKAAIDQAERVVRATAKR